MLGYVFDNSLVLGALLVLAAGLSGLVILMNWKGLFKMTDAQAPRWAAVRKAGRRRYVLDGVLRDVLLAIVWAAISYWWGAPGPFLGLLAVALVVFPLFGLAFSSWRWSFHERRYLAWRRQSLTSSVAPQAAGGE